MTFSLDHFEWLVHRRRNEEAARALVALIGELDKNWGGMQELRDYPQTGRQDPDNLRYVTRVSAAISRLFADESFALSFQGYQLFTVMHWWLSAIFGASAFHNADHVLRAFNVHGESGGAGFEVRDRDMLKFALLFSLDSQVPLDLDTLWAKNRTIGSALFLGILSARIVLSDAAHEKREKLLEWFPQRLNELRLTDIPAGYLHHVWMNCTYAVTSQRHSIKRALNRLIRDDLLSSGLSDDTRDRRPMERDKPVVVVVLDRFHSHHAVFRLFSRLLAGLRPDFRLVAICTHEAPDAPAAELFDRHVVAEMGASGALIDVVRAVAAAVHDEAPDIVFYLGVGMTLPGIFLANLRLAPIQIASWGHPATTRSEQMDYFLLENFHEVGEPDFSERLLLVPPSAFVSIPPPKPEFERPGKIGGGVINVAVVVTVMKLNPFFLRACREVLNRAKVPLRLHFLLGAAYGVATMYVDNLIRRIIPEAVVYPQMPQESYFRAIAAADMCLDPFPFGNMTTLIDYASEGVPTISLLGDRIFSRQGALVIKRLGLPEWLVAENAEEYVDKAVELAANAPLRESLSSYLCDAFQPSKIGSLGIFSGDDKLVCRAFRMVLDNHERIKEQNARIVRIN